MGNKINAEIHVVNSCFSSLVSFGEIDDKIRSFHWIIALFLKCLGWITEVNTRDGTLYLSSHQFKKWCDSHETITLKGDNPTPSSPESAIDRRSCKSYSDKALAILSKRKEDWGEHFLLPACDYYSKAVECADGENTRKYFKAIHFTVTELKTLWVPYKTLSSAMPFENVDELDQQRSEWERVLDTAKDLPANFTATQQKLDALRKTYELYIKMRDEDIPEIAADESLKDLKKCFVEVIDPPAVLGTLVNHFTAARRMVVIARAFYKHATAAKAELEAAQKEDTLRIAQETEAAAQKALQRQQEAEQKRKADESAKELQRKTERIAAEKLKEQEEQAKQEAEKAEQLGLATANAAAQVKVETEPASQAEPAPPAAAAAEPQQMQQEREQKKEEQKAVVAVKESAKAVDRKKIFYHARSVPDVLYLLFVEFVWIPPLDRSTRDLYKKEKYKVQIKKIRWTHLVSLYEEHKDLRLYCFPPNPIKTIPQELFHELTRDWTFKNLKKEQIPEKARLIAKRIRETNRIFFCWQDPKQTQAMLELGANPNKLFEDDADPEKMKPQHMLTPLHAAVYYGQFKVYQILREWGGNPRIKTPTGYTADGLARAMLAGNVSGCVKLKESLPGTSCERYYFPYYSNKDHRAARKMPTHSITEGLKQIIAYEESLSAAAPDATP